MKKGFTLIELLAVITILGIVLAIAIPSITSLVDGTTKKAFETNAKMVLNALRLKIIEDNNFDPTTVIETNIQTLLNLDDSNYNKIIVQQVNGRIFLTITGKSKYKNLVVSGDNNNIQAYRGLIIDDHALWFNGNDFINNSEGLTWINRAGNSYNGTPFNFNYSSSSGSDGEGGVVFDGINDYVLLNNVLNLGNGDLPWTVNAWVKTTTTVGNLAGVGPILSNSSGGPVYSTMGVNAGKMVYWHYDQSAGGPWTSILGNITVNDNQWHMLTWVQKNNYTMDMYVDGVLDRSNVFSRAGNNNPINILGGSYNARFNGNIADIQVHRRSFSSQEVMENFNALKEKIDM